MDKINLYNVYQNSYYNKTNQAGKNGQGTKADNAKEARETAAKESKVELSQAAKDLLKELKSKYGDTDFIIANYETDEEATSYLSRGTGAYSVLMTPEELEKMAVDEKKKNENLALLDEAFVKLDEMKNQLGDKGEEVKRLGVAMGDNGELSFFAELEKVNEKQRERMEKAREEKKADTKEVESKVDGKEDAAEEVWAEKYGVGKYTKTTVVYASTTEELLEKITAVDWNAIKEKIPGDTGARFDFTV